MPRPMDSFLCPYCFGKIKHDLVHFRSARVDTDPTGILPDEYDIHDENDVNRFREKYNKPDKEDREKKLDEWLLFSLKEDERYEKFWKDHGGVKTEVDPWKKHTGIDVYLRPIINPSRVKDRMYLQTQPDGGVFVFDADGMAEKVKLKDGTPCSDRVCPHCHNPLPPDYGKYPIKFVTIIGVTSSGKTVYLSQLLKHMDEYVAKVGLASEVRSPASKQFFSKDNVVAKGEGLPGSTPAKQFQQPLFYDLSRRMVNGSIQRNTFVLYDVAGEVFRDQKDIEVYAECVGYSDGFIMLIDPKDLRYAGRVPGGEQSLETPNTVLGQVRIIVHDGKADGKCEKPFAICVSKTDTKLVQDIFEDSLLEDLRNDVVEVKGDDGWAKPAFNASGYDSIAQGMNSFMREYERAFALNLLTNYETYAFFGFTALGCEVENNIPTGPILPKRIEEPLLWLLYELGIIGKEGTYTLPNPKPVTCPKCGCGSDDIRELTGKDTYERRPFPWSPIRCVNRKCMHCGHTWNQEAER